MQMGGGGDEGEVRESRCVNEFFEIVKHRAMEKERKNEMH